MKDQQHQPRDLDGNPVTPGLPMAMLAEVTHRCPLACPYCSNPVDLVRASREIGADDWGRVFRQAADLACCRSISRAVNPVRGAIWRRSWAMRATRGCT